MIEQQQVQQPLPATILLSDNQQQVAQQNPSSSSNNAERDADFESRNALNTKRTVGSVFNFDLTNTENYGTDDSELPEALFMDIISINFFSPMAGSDKDDDPDASHGIIATVTGKVAAIWPGTSSPILSTETYLLDVGVGYQYNIKQELFLYGTLNTVAYFSSTTTFYGDTPDVSVDDSFPEDSAYMRLGAYWTPIKINASNRFGLHAGLQMPFAEGAESSFYLGLAFR